jgi:hypothetical protein
LGSSYFFSSFVLGEKRRKWLYRTHVELKTKSSRSFKSKKWLRHFLLWS